MQKAATTPITLNSEGEAPSRLTLKIWFVGCCVKKNRPKNGKNKVNDDRCVAWWVAESLDGKARRRSEKFTSVLKSQYFNDVKNYVYFGYRDTEY